MKALDIKKETMGEKPFYILMQMDQTITLLSLEKIGCFFGIDEFFQQVALFFVLAADRKIE